MGKKRNAAKKKQAAKKKRLSASSKCYGVSVLKGGTTRKNGALDDANPTADNSQTKQSNGVSFNGDGNMTNTASAPHSTTSNNNCTTDLNRQLRDNHNSEKDEFQRRHASLEERSLALQARKDDQQRSKRERQKHQKKGWGKFARPLTTKFAPATLSLAPKSTQQLVDDAAEQVARGMHEIGRNAASASSDGALVTTLGRSSLAEAASLNWKLRVSNVSTSPQQAQTEDQTNPFASLEEDSDSDNEWAEKNTKLLPFQFKPASFSFQPTITNEPYEYPADDVDSDL